MSFGIKKYGVNNTDKKLIARFVRAGWPLDKISNKLSVHTSLIQKVINFQAKKGVAAEAKPASAQLPAAAEVETEVETEDIPVAAKEPTKAEQKALQKANAAATGKSGD